MTTRAFLGAVTAARSEVTWWLRILLRLVHRFPGQVTVTLGLAWFGWLHLGGVWFGVTAAVVVTLRVWALIRPLGFHRFAVQPVRGWCRRRWIRRHWPAAAQACGLGVSVTTSQTSRDRATTTTPRPVVRVTVPRLVAVRSDGPRLRLRVRPILGQTPEDIEAAGERLRTAVAATRVRVEPHRANEALVTFTMGDVLAAPFAASQPTRAAAAVNTERVWLGVTESGSDWWLPVGPHTLVAGCSGAGKGSVFWSFAFGLAPAVKHGSVRLHGVDLKGGMEILMGAELFTTRATNAAEAVVLLENLVRQMQSRTVAYAGRVRSHTATFTEPLHVVMIDELAALTAYCPERDLQRRAEMAINLICSQGRAPGFMVLACLQDPRKEVIPSRGLFTQMVGLRLKDLNETTMVLGETAVASGAHCHRITRTTPGTGYVVPEDGGYPVRVRAGYASDHAIRAVAKEFASPVHRPVVVPVQDPAELTRRSRATQQSGAA